MKKILISLACCLLAIQLFSQAPQKLSYQMVIRDGSNVLLPNKPVKIRLSVLQSSTDGSVIFSEAHSSVTNENGLVSLEIGDGTTITGSFSSIDWGKGPYFLKTETDPNNGTNYSIVGTTQLLSVPYALHAGNGVVKGKVKNQLMYWDGVDWVILNPGSHGQALTICNGELTWSKGGDCPVAPSIASLNCSQVSGNSYYRDPNTEGTYSPFQTTVKIPYTGGNGGIYSSQTIQSATDSSWIATLVADTLEMGDGYLTYLINGTSPDIGQERGETFDLNFGGQSCKIYVSVQVGYFCDDFSPDCARASYSGVLKEGEAANGVSISLPFYNSGMGICGRSYDAGGATSDIVQGINLSWDAFYLDPYKYNNNSVNLSVTGTPTSSGAAVFSFFIGGGSCEISIPVLPAKTTGITAHSCGAENVHNDTIPYGTMTDQQGNVYRTVQIGTQTWMAENLRTTVYRNGESIPNITNNTDWASPPSGAYCSYNHDTINDCPYGKLYNWYAVANTNQLCPTGWHVPSDDEWILLTNYLDGAAAAGSKLKSTGTQYWQTPNSDATNSYGFSALPGGWRDFFGYFGGFSYIGYWWTSTEYDTSDAWYRTMAHNDSSVNKAYYAYRTLGLSVRCVKD